MRKLFIVGSLIIVGAVVWLLSVTSQNGKPTHTPYTPTAPLIAPTREIERVSVEDPAEGDGIVTVEPIPTGGIWKGNDTGATERSVFTVRIDNLKPISVTTDRAGSFTGLTLAERHLVDIQVDGHRLTSFRFAFKDRGADHLRLWYKPVYGTWSLTPARTAK